METGKRRAVLVEAEVPAGFPSPASDYVEKAIDLNTHLIVHPSATFFVRARGDSMIEAGISDQDLLIVDRAFKARSGDIVIAVIDGDFTVKRLAVSGTAALLIADNPKYQPIDITDRSDTEIWGVVTYVVKKTR
jgi:DNA polymerase V